MPTVAEVSRRLTGITGHVAVAIWQREDVIEMGKRKGVILSPQAADEILDDIDNHHDAELGITWDTLDCQIDEWKRDHPNYRRYHGEENEEEE